ncbi:MAG: hypothetical protein ABJC09_12605 [Terriglobia bacterium]
MPLQNRIDPCGRIFRTEARGTIMGNRGGVLHRDREIVRTFKSRRWIACLLEFKGRRRVVMTEKRYTELFFLDEAVAFAAGHRPCAECRRERFNAFKEAWRRVKGLDKLPFADEMDSVLHSARIDSSRNKVTWQAELRSLPDGCLVQLEGRPFLVWRDGLFLWTPQGYHRRASAPEDKIVTVLTPEPIAGCFREGYTPQIHYSVTESC